MADSRAAAILSRAQRALGSNTPAEAVRKVRAIIGAKNVPNSEAEAQHALKTLQDGETPTASQLAALEIVIRLMRPVVLSRGGALEDLPETSNKDLQPAPLKEAWAKFRAEAHGYISSVGRIEDRNMRHVGTGFVVGQNLIATNRHVLDVLTNGAEVISSGSARIVFKQEVGETNAANDIAGISDVVHIHPTKDIAILRTDTGDRLPVRFARTIPSIGTTVATLGFPGKDETNNPIFLTAVFDGKFGMKAAALGEILDGTDSLTFFHDCSTTRGNSGSPVFLVPTADVVGIHRSGFFMYRNEAVASEELRALLEGAV